MENNEVKETSTAFIRLEHENDEKFEPILSSDDLTDIERYSLLFTTTKIKGKDA